MMVKTLSNVLWQSNTESSKIIRLVLLEKACLPCTIYRMEKENLGRSTRLSSEPPTKWEVYEQILNVPYYVVFDRYTDRLRGFALTAGFYQELELTEPRIWIPQLELGLGLWSGEYDGINRLWLRWYDAQGNWILTPTEREAIAQAQLEAERQRAEAERVRSQRLEELLRSHGIDPNS